MSQIFGGLRYDLAVLRAVFAEDAEMIESPFLQDLEARWSRRAVHRHILAVLTRRFGQTPDDVSAAVRQVTDDDALTDVGAAAGSAATLDDFRAALPR